MLRRHSFTILNWLKSPMVSTVLIVVAACTLPVLLVVVYFTIVFFQQCWLLRRFKGPLPLPLVGNCYKPEVASFFNYLAKLRKVYGSVFTFFGFTKARLVVMDPVVVRRILSDTKAFPKGSDYSHTFSHVFGQGLVTSNGEKHKKDRGVFGRFFVRGYITKMAPTFNEICDHAIQELLEGCATNNDRPSSVNIEKFFAICALRLFMKFSTGADYYKRPDREKIICKCVSAASNATGQLVVFGLPLLSILPQVKVMDKCLKEVRVEFDQAVTQRRSEHAQGINLELDDCLNAMFVEKMNEKDMFDHFMTLICAGHDTSAYFSSYLIFLLAKHQDVQDKLRAEIMAHFKGRTEVTPDDTVELKYLTKVMQETLRMYAVIPALSRVSVEEVHIKEANITIPKGVELFIPLSIINRDPTIWENPSVFNPDRFDEKCDFTSAKNGFFPFGYGSRTCIGNTLAQIESSILICKLLMRFKFEQDPGFKIKIVAGISLTTKKGINVICRPL